MQQGMWKRIQMQKTRLLHQPRWISIFKSKMNKQKKKEKRKKIVVTLGKNLGMSLMVKTGPLDRSPLTSLFLIWKTV